MASCALNRYTFSCPPNTTGELPSGFYVWNLQGIPEMRVQSRLFSSNSKSWEALCDEAAAFASEVGRERLINISVAASGGTEFLGMGGTGVLIVWYWE